MATTRNFTYGKDVSVANFYLSNAPTRETPGGQRDAKLALAGVSRVTFGDSVGSMNRLIYAAIAEVTAAGVGAYRVANAWLDIDKGVVDFFLPRRAGLLTAANGVLRVAASSPVLYRIGVKIGSNTSIIVQGTMTYDPTISGGVSGNSPAGSVALQPTAEIGKYPPVSSHAGMNATGGPT